MAATPTPRPTLRVLIADDAGDIAAWMSVLLRVHGYDVRSATSGVEALSLGEEFAPQVMLLDIGMPGMDGFETARRVRAQPWGRQIMLVALTGWGEPEDLAQARAAGFDLHLLKPVQSERLLSVLAGVAAAHP